MYLSSHSHKCYANYLIFCMWCSAYIEGDSKIEISFRNYSRDLVISEVLGQKSLSACIASTPRNSFSLIYPCLSYLTLAIFLQARSVSIHTRTSSLAIPPNTVLKCLRLFDTFLFQRAILYMSFWCSVNILMISLGRSIVLEYNLMHVVTCIQNGVCHF